MPAADLPLLVAAARQAGRIAAGFAGRTARTWDKPGGAGPVTEADIAVNDMLERELRAARPDYGWLSEETEDTPARLDRARVFIVDPIDGTRSFAEGSDTWAHALAVAENGIVTAAVVYLPLREMMFCAAAGQGAVLNGAPIAPSRRATLDGAQILAAAPALNPPHWRGGVALRFARAYLPSLAYRMALVAQGRFDGMLTLRPSWEWDVAAGELILREAGAVCTDRAGAPLRFNNPRPRVNGVIAAGARVHRLVRDALAPAGPAP